MAGLRDIRRRINSVSSMWQITKAMKMVAASKLRKSRERVEASRPYAEQMRNVLARLVQSETGGNNPLLEKRPVKNIAYVVVTSDNGLCGGFNANLVRAARKKAEETKDAGVEFITVGRKGYEYFSRQDIKLVSHFADLGDVPNYDTANRIAQDVVKRYESGEVDQVNILYSKFISMLTQQPTMLQLLPVEPSGEKLSGQYLFEPEPEEMLKKLLPNYLDSEILSTLLESKAGEMASKMMAMDSATRNAKKMIDKLTMDMNRARQSAITTEITEIVSGAAALE